MFLPLIYFQRFSIGSSIQTVRLPINFTGLAKAERQLQELHIYSPALFQPRVRHIEFSFDRAVRS